MRPYLQKKKKKTLHKNRTGEVAQGIDTKFKPQHHKKRKKESCI
jgi:hypothetical protein